MSESVTADWTCDGMTLYFGEIGANYVGLQGATLAAHIAQAHNEAMASLRRQIVALERAIVQAGHDLDCALQYGGACSCRMQLVQWHRKGARE